MWRHLEDGDWVLVARRMDDGRVVERKAEFSALLLDPDEEKAFLEHHLDRADGCTDVIPLEQIVGMRFLRHEPSYESLDAEEAPSRNEVEAEADPDVFAYLRRLVGYLEAAGRTGGAQPGETPRAYAAGALHALTSMGILSERDIAHWWSSLAETGGGRALGVDDLTVRQVTEPPNPPSRDD